MSNLGGYQDMTTNAKKDGGPEAFFEKHDAIVRAEGFEEGNKRGIVKGMAIGLASGAFGNGIYHVVKRLTINNARKRKLDEYFENAQYELEERLRRSEKAEVEANQKVVDKILEEEKL